MCRIHWLLGCMLAFASCSNDPSQSEGTAMSKPATSSPEQALSTKARADASSASEEDRKALAQSNRAFAFNLYAELATQRAGNLFFSPYSISSALAMTYAGARGKTAEEMRSTLHFTLPDERVHAAFNASAQQLTAPVADAAGDFVPFTLDMVNAVWAQRDKNFLQSYLDTLATNYGAGVRLLDFGCDTEASRRTINEWVALQTHDRIMELLRREDLSDTTMLILTNAIYFKARWTHAFAKSRTKDGTFHAPSGDQTAPIMHGALSTLYTRGDGFQTVQLPYEGSSSEMLLILPDAGKLAAVEAELNEGLLSSIASQAQAYDVTLSLPKFSFDTRLSLADTLIKLGMRRAFTENADFSGIDGDLGLLLAAVIHQAFVAVDESGTEAAAATAVIFAGSSAPPPQPQVEVDVDRPFILALRDRTSGDLLFLGRVSSVTP